MQFLQAVAKANEAVKSRKKWPGDYKFSSAVCVLNAGELTDWILIYSVPGDNEVISVTASEPLKMKKSKAPNFKDYKRVDVSQVKVPPEEVVQKARQLTSARAKTVTKEIIALRQEDHPVWRMVSFTNQLEVFVMEFDAVTGEMLSEKTDSLITSM